MPNVDNKILVVDIDETLIVIKKNKDLIDHSHEPQEYFEANIGGLTVEVGIINPLKIADVFNKGNYEAIIFLTAGSWDQTLIYAVAGELKEKYLLSNNAENKLKQALVSSHMTELFLYIDLQFFSQFARNFDFADEQQLVQYQAMHDYISVMLKFIQATPKNQRLQKIIEHYQITNKEFIVLDNCEGHIASFKDMQNVTAIRATTDTENCTFYDETLAALQSSPRKEQEDNSAPTGNLTPDNVRSSLINTSTFFHTFYGVGTTILQNSEQNHKAIVNQP